jgi:hypothetical protein
MTPDSAFLEVAGRQARDPHFPNIRRRTQMEARGRNSNGIRSADCPTWPGRHKKVSNKYTLTFLLRSPKDDQGTSPSRYRT